MWRMLTGMLVLAAPATCDAQYGVYFDAHQPDPDSPAHLHHPHVDGVFLRWEWAELEPHPGRYEFQIIERDVAPWAKAGKKVLIGIKPAGQHNRSTPGWVYDRVPPIRFTRSGKGTKVSVPTYWDGQFLPAMSGLVEALGRTYGEDPRIEAVMVGVGHLGFLTAAPNSGGSKAFLAAGWTPDRWKTYTFGVIEEYRRSFPGKPLFLRASDLVLRVPEPARLGFAGSRPYFNDLRDQILRTAAEKYGIGIGANGLSADRREFLATGLPKLFEELGPGARAGKYRLELSDDWPLWVAPDRRTAATVDRHKDNAWFVQSLENAIGGSHAIPRTHVGWIKLLESDLNSTDPQHPDYQPECERALKRLKERLLAP